MCPSTRPRTAVTTMDRSQQRQGLWPSIFSSSGSRRDWSRSKAATNHRCQLGSIERFYDPFNNIYKTVTESQESSTVATCPEKYMNDKNKDILCSLWNEYQVIAYAYKTSEPFIFLKSFCLKMLQQSHGLNDEVMIKAQYVRCNIGEADSSVCR